MTAATGWSTTTPVHFKIYSVSVTNTLVAGTETIWKATLSGTTLSNMQLKSGTEPTGGYAIGDVIEPMFTHQQMDDLYSWGAQEHNVDGTHSAITATSLNATSAVSADTISEHTAGAGVTVDGVLLKDNKVATSGAVDSTSVSAGMPVQVVNTTSTAVATGTTTIPLDDTIPQITEGTEFMTLAITPKSATNILVIDVLAYVATGTAAKNIIAALFQDATSNALAATAVNQQTANNPFLIPLKHTMVAGSTSSTTFRLRIGADAAATVTFNGASATRQFGAITKSAIIISEYKA